MIEFTQLYYLVTIVDNEYNLTRSARVLHVSQPALSKSIGELEFRESVKVFRRSKGRIVGLTTVGTKLVRDARQVLSEYGHMMDRLQTTGQHTGTIRLGIPPVVISTVLAHALADFIAANPGIRVNLVERGAYELEQMLAKDQLDLAVLLPPVHSSAIESTLVYQDSVSVWFSPQHRFNQFSEPIPLTAIAEENIVTLSDDFKVTQELRKRLLEAGIQPEFFLQTGSWDLILNLCQTGDTVGILATPIGDNFRSQVVEHRPIAPFFPWKSAVCTLRDVRRSTLINYSRDWLIDYFSRQGGYPNENQNAKLIANH